MPKAAPLVELTLEQVAALEAWNQAKQQLVAAQSDEMVKRMAAIKIIPFSEEKQEGSQSVKLNQGWTLKLDRPTNYTMEKDIQLVTAAMTKLAEVNPGAAQELMRWEAVCSTGAYKKLTDEERLIVAPIITIKPGTPSLTLSPPPVKKD